MRRAPQLSQLFGTGSGCLQVLAGAIVPNGPPYVTNSISGHTLSLSWPAGQGWRLQMETNAASPNWAYLTNGSINRANITVDPTEPSVFYRLTYL